MKTEARQRKRAGTLIAIIVLAAIAALAAYYATRDDAPAPGEIRMFSGFIRDVRQDGTLVIDEAEMLSGEEAIEKGVEDTDCERERIEECIPSMNNDFYVRNRDASTREYRAIEFPEVLIFESPGSPALKNVTFDQFKKDYLDPNLLMQQFLFNFRSRGGLIVKIEEQYTP